MRPLRREIIFGENCFDRTFWHARVAVDASLGVDYEHVVIEMKCFDGAGNRAIGITAINAWLGDDISHANVTST